MKYAAHAAFWDVAGSVPLFAGLDTHAREALARAARRRAIPAGHTLHSPAQPIESVYVIESGLLSVSIPDEQGAIEVARLGPGEYCGELSLVRHTHSGAVVRALADSTVWEIPHHVLEEAAEASPVMLRALAAVLAERLSDTNRRLKRLRARGRLVVCLSAGETVWASAVVARVAESASRLLARPAHLLDLTAGDDAAPPSPDAIDALLASHPLVILHATEDSAFAAWSVAADRVLMLMPEREAERTGRARPVRGCEVVLLRDGPAPGSEGDLRRAAAALGAPVLRIVPGGRFALAATPPAARDAEPWRSVDWLARHLLGRKVGLALGAGGAKGYAHLGVIQALREAGVPLDVVAGSSIGAPLAAGAAIAMPVDEIRHHMDDLFRQLARFRLPWRSVWSNEPLTRGFQRLAGARRFEDLAVPLSIVAADIDRREQYVFRDGPIAAAILASTAIPAVFPPVEVGGRRLVDGAVLNPVPVDALTAAGADIVIGVRLNPPADSTDPRPGWRARIRPPIVETILRAFDLMQWKIGAEGAARADVTIEPLFFGATGLREFGRGDEFIEAGRRAVEDALPRLRDRLPWLDSPTDEARLAA
jgi:predicted acylesterase/phospholipase RssA/CRP-like cAMP-binding protein